MRIFSELDKTRVIDLEGAHNARDMGGFKTANGEVVRRGLVFRSDELSGLTEGDMRCLGGFGIKTVVDFRSQAEIERSRDRSLEHVRKFELNIDCGDLEPVLDEVNEQTGPKLMKGVNRLLVKKSVDAYREFFSLLTHGANVPLLFHCTAGKDRTGFAAAMFLSSLGVSREEIFRDYLLSSIGAKRKYSALIEKSPRFISIVTVRREYLTAAFDEIEADFGSVGSYLTDALDVDLDNMRRLFTERAN